MSVGLTISGVSKRYGNNQVLSGINLEVQPGEFFSLVGPSGCGKTTLLRCVAGFVRPDAGEIVCDGQRLDPLPPHQRNLGMVFQNYALFPHLSVFDNVAYGLRARKAPAALIRERVERALEMVHLAHRARSTPGMLSGGEQQRVATARALAIEPRLLLMDEPLSNLDAKLRVEMREEIRRVQKQMGITTLYVTHDQEEALALSDRIAVMSAGHLEQVGNPLDIYRQPATRFVAGFIGQMNFLPGRVEAAEPAGTRVRLGEGGPVLLAQPGPWEAGQAVTLAVRPEHLALAPGANSLPGRVEEIVFLGAVTRLRVVTAAGPLTVEVGADEAADLKPGQEVTLGCAPGECAVFGEG